jgi:hypothetical protein
MVVCIQCAEVLCVDCDRVSHRAAEHARQPLPSRGGSQPPTPAC